MKRGSDGSAVLLLVLLAAAMAAAPPDGHAQAATPRPGGAQAASPPEATAAERGIAADYLRRARQAFAAGQPAQARELLEVALEFSPRCSESAYLYARTLLAEQRGSYRAVPYLRLALEAGTWSETRPLEAVTALAGFYARTGNSGDARRLLESLDRAETPALLQGATTPALARIWASVLVAEGQGPAAEAYLRRASARFPQSAELYLMLGRVLAARGRNGEAAEVLRSGTRLLPQEAELVLALAALERSSAGRVEAVERYLSMQGSDPSAALLALRADPKEPIEYFEAFLRLGGEERIADLDALLQLLRQRAAAEGPAGGAYSLMAGRMAEALRRYTGERSLDADGDGLYEQLYEYLAGELQRWHLDADQDGRREAEVSFQAGLPVAVVLYPDGPLAGGGGLPQPTVEMRYESYPVLKEVSFVDRASRRTYSLLPGRLRAAAFAALPATLPAAGAAGVLPAGPLRLRYGDELPAEEPQVRRLSYSMDEHPGDGQPGLRPARRYQLHEGRVVRLEQSPDSGGVYRHVLDYGASGPSAGRRDRDGDGRWELREQYTDGVLTRVLLDADGDGVDEFAQSLHEGGWRMWWDYDGDGRYDSTQYQDTEGRTVQEFSSRLDGVYDLRAVFRGERLVRVQRGERTLPVSRDERRGLYWVGKPVALPPESLEALAGLPAGAHTIGGRSLYVFRYGGELYVGESE